MADWSQLPKELLLLISQRLEICFDLTHFRSVCSSWRSSVPRKPCLLPASFPLTPFNDKTITLFRLSKRIIVLIRLSENHNQAAPNRWLVKVEEDKHKGIHILNPLSNSSIKGSKVLDLLNCHVIEFSREYVLHFHVYHPHPLEPINRNFQHKVAFMWSSTLKNDYVLLTFYRYGYLAMLRSTDKQWIVLENMPRPCRDIISFNGKFYALAEEGRTMVVEPSSNVSFLAHFGSNNSNSKKFFVESSGQLLLVESGLLINNGPERSMQQGWRSPLKMIWFKIYKLNEAGQKWDDVKSLGDRVLIWGNHGSFSASASELSLSKGNYIIFGMRRFDWNYEQFCDVEFSDMYVFNYENGSVKPLRKHPDFLKLFRPPRDWVTSAAQ